MGAWLEDHPPRRDQFRIGRRLDRSPLKGRCTGLTVLHTAESVMDTVGPDTGSENVARFIAGRLEPGSYHHLVDSDSRINLVALENEAYQDGTGSNPWALSIAFACKTTDWPRMSAVRRRAFLWQGALAFLDQQRWLRARGFPTTDLRLLTKSQSDAGVSGFVYHGTRDPLRRSDPGMTTFPFGEWIDVVRQAAGGDEEFTVDDEAKVEFGKVKSGIESLGARMGGIMTLLEEAGLGPRLTELMRESDLHSRQNDTIGTRAHSALEQIAVLHGKVDGLALALQQGPAGLDLAAVLEAADRGARAGAAAVLEDVRFTVTVDADTDEEQG